MVPPTVAVILSIYAAIVSTTSLAVAILAYRAAGPKIEVRAYYGPQERARSRENVLVVTAHNSGRSESTIDILGFSYLDGSGFGRGLDEQIPVKPMRRLTQRVNWEGPDRPYRLPGNDDVEWTSNMELIMYDLGREIDPDDKASVLVRIGTRKRLVPVRHRRFVELVYTVDSSGKQKFLGAARIEAPPQGQADS
jgi:hypothetical protein